MIGACSIPPSTFRASLYACRGLRAGGGITASGGRRQEREALVTTTTAVPLTLPSLEEIQEAEDKLGGALSDLDSFVNTVKLIDGRKAPDELLAAGNLDAIIAYETPPPWI